MSTMNKCVVCIKERATVKCEGCEQYYCHKHFVEHKALQYERREIQNELRNSCQEILETQHFYRDYDQQSIDTITRREHELKDNMNRMMTEMPRCCKNDNFTKTHLREMKWGLSQFYHELARLRNDMTGNHGVPFVDLSDTNGYKRVLWNISAPKWRRAVRGMCLEGFCENEKCEAYGQRVIIGIGMREFDLLVDPSPSTTPCPMCKQYVEPTTCGFNNCQWRWHGIKQMSRQPPMSMSGDWKRADNAYHYFDQTIKGTATTSGTCIWRQLKIEAKDLS